MAGLIISLATRAYYQHVRPQVDYIMTWKGALLVDTIIRYEDLKGQLESIASHLGLNMPIPHVSRSVRRNYQDYYCDETKAIIQSVYASDIERFGYTCEKGI